MRALVTGGAGFIGGHLVRRLLAEGHDVAVLDDFSGGGEIAAREKLRLVRGDYCDEAPARDALQSRDTLFHLAAMVSVPESIARPEQCRAVNVDGTRRLFTLAQAAGVRRIVFASSCAVYGPGIEGPIPESLAPRPLSPYAESKLEGERMLRDMAGGASSVALRFFNAYGPGQRADSAYAAAIPRFIQAARNGESPVIYGDGGQTRDFIHVEDIARALLRAAEIPVSGSGAVFNIGTEKAVSLNEVLALLRALPGSRLGGTRFEPARPGDIRHSLADCSAARKAMGFSAGIDFAAGLRRLWHTG